MAPRPRRGAERKPPEEALLAAPRRPWLPSPQKGARRHRRRLPWAPLAAGPPGCPGGCGDGGAAAQAAAEASPPRRGCRGRDGLGESGGVRGERAGREGIRFTFRAWVPRGGRAKGVHCTRIAVRGRGFSPPCLRKMSASGRRGGRRALAAPRPPLLAGPGLLSAGLWGGGDAERLSLGPSCVRAGHGVCV